MKTIILISFALISLVEITFAQDTLYIWRRGDVLGQYPVGKTDSVTFKGYDVFDASGKGYNLITIGQQTWFLQNLKTTKYNDGTDIPKVTDAGEWGSLNTGAYCLYNNLDAVPYGALYNWYAVESYKLCPSGYHVATYEEWEQLNTFLGGSEVSGGKLKATTLWDGDNVGANNESGFYGRAAGMRDGSGAYNDFGWATRWWTETSDEADQTKASFKMLHSVTQEFWEGVESKNHGYSVRCIKD